MGNFNLSDGTPLEMLRQFTIYLNAELREDLGAARMFLNNDHGQGTITLYEVFPGLTAWVYNITFFSDFQIDLTFSKERPYYFGYNLSGHQMQKFDGETEYQKMKQGQNFILISKPGGDSEFITPANKKFESCYVIIHPKLLNRPKTGIQKQLAANLAQIFSHVDTEGSYRYLGNIDLRTGAFAEILLNNQRTDLVGRLRTESTILKLLASQIDAHYKDVKTISFQPSLWKDELERVDGLGDYIRENLLEEPSIVSLCNHIGLSPRKLQVGIQFLYGTSIDNYIKNIRLGVAMELIHTGDLEIAEICYTVGYSNRSDFYKAFNIRYGITPVKYRDSLRSIESHEDARLQKSDRRFA